MTIKEKVQEEIKTAMRAKETFRLECLRMAKGALLLKEKETGKPATEEQSVAVLRAEVKKRQQTAETYRELGKPDEAASAEREAAIIEEFLPRQLSESDLEAKVRAYVAAHPEVNHAGKLTGALKKELGDSADGKLLNDVVKRVLGV